MKFLLDTNTVSEPLRPQPDPHVLEQLRKHEAEVAIPAPVWHELRFGCARLPPSRRRDALERYLDEVVRLSMPVLNYGRRAADWHAREGARLVSSGRTPPFVDGQIAAIAAVQGLVLVTSNTRDFLAFDGLKIENWLKS